MHAQSINWAWSFGEELRGIFPDSGTASEFCGEPFSGTPCRAPFAEVSAKSAREQFQGHALVEPRHNGFEIVYCLFAHASKMAAIWERFNLPAVHNQLTQCPYRSTQRMRARSTARMPSGGGSHRWGINLGLLREAQSDFKRQPTVTARPACNTATAGADQRSNRRFHSLTERSMPPISLDPVFPMRLGDYDRLANFFPRVRGITHPSMDRSGRATVR